MTPKSLTRLLLIILTCVISGAISGYLVGPHGAQGSILATPIWLLYDRTFQTTVTVPLLLQFLSPGIFFGILFAVVVTLGAGEVGNRIPISHVGASVAGFTIGSTAIWFLGYWIVELLSLEVPLASNFKLPGTIAGLCAGGLLSISARLLPNVRVQTKRWTAIVGGVAGLLFFLNPGTDFGPATWTPLLYQAFPAIGWCISFALWQTAVGLSIYLSMGPSAAPLSAPSTSARLPAEANRPLDR